MYTIPCHDRGHINVVFVFQSCSDPLHILPGSSCDTNAASSDSGYHIANIKVEEDVDMQREEGEVNVKTEKGIGSEEEECRSVKEEEGIHSVEEEDEDIDIKEEEHVGIKDELSLKVQRNKC